MDPALLAQRAAFQKSASRNVSVQQRPQPSSSRDSHSTYNPEAAKKKKKTTSSAKNNVELDLKAAQNASMNAINFQTIAKIVDYMKKRHLNAQHWALSLTDILDEIQVHDLSKKTENFLKEVLPTNPKLQEADGKFTYNPPFKIKNKATLLSQVRKHHEDAKGGILLSLINDCIPNAEKVIESLGKEVIVVPTQVNKRKDKVVFYNDPTYDFPIEDEFKAVWRNIAIEHLDEKKIEDYLQKHGIDAMKDLAPKKLMGPPKRKTPKRRPTGKVHNEHLSHVLKDYE